VVKNMKHTTKNDILLIIVLLISFMIIVGGAFIYFNESPKNYYIATKISTNNEKSVIGPLPLYKHHAVKVLSLNEFTNIMKSKNITIHIPTYIPYGSRVTAVW